MFIHKYILSRCLLSARLCAGLCRCRDWGRGGGGSQNDLTPPGLPGGERWSLFPELLACAHNCFEIIFLAQTQHKLFAERGARVRRRSQSSHQSLNGSSWPDSEQPAENKNSDRHLPYISSDLWSRSTSAIA